VFTETEAAAVGAAGAFVFALARKRITRASIAQVMGETTATTALLYLIIFGVLTFSFSMGVTGLPQRMTAFFQQLDWAPLAVLFLLLAVYIALGCVMDSNTVMFVTVPIVAPLISGMGYDLIWWGVVNLVVLETGLITPPFGIHLFVLKGILGTNVPLATVYRGVMPFVAADLAKLALLLVFPALALWLPSTMAR
jgi:TRAP-type C4-dicarboxylate transport system permease large subunit